ncbi:ABC-2 type transport system ATP-binding protein [Flexibacter flexilis DSM 6793]|uniref:ABC-2 type transport system ATP-binding protein n=1 Tax=Flexibacter flexilis DSM 6793 TaxID=927664 RepID=A0A1I1KL11_9BACT|nr:gliding motility-associated ABC transporter ATP-binding subunit GldA [Flexibacter flexilis]SFC61361.1 ABC-2 type transport system ATP-binding protein [Flexibacter flexilis DSM 6793]
MSIAVQNLIKTYGTQNAVDDISFEVKKGEVLGFLGPNGAGKSTTMKIATCYLPPTSGSVQICGLDVQENALEVRRKVGYLPEHNPLYLDMFVREYLEFSGSIYGISGKTLNQRIGEVVEQTGLSIEQNKKIGALSKGYRQRVGLAQVLIHNPEVLILDEPTTGLDPNQIVEIRQLIKNIGKEKTVIFSTHIMQEVQALCDRVVIINRGKIVADSPVSSLQNNSQGKAIITAEFDADVDTKLLQSIAGVVSVKHLKTGVYQITEQAGADVRGSVFKLATAQNWTLLGLKQEENSLEKIFHDLTVQKD